MPPNWPARLGWLLLAGYVAYAATKLDVSWARFVTGMANAERFLGRMFPPNLAPD